MHPPPRRPARDGAGIRPFRLTAMSEDIRGGPVVLASDKGRSDQIALLQIASAARTIVNRNRNTFGAIMSPIKESNHQLADIRLPATMAELQDIRDSIDNIDASIIHMLAERFRCTQKVGILKAQHNLPPSDPDREAQQITRLRQLPTTAKLDPEFAEKFLAFVVREVIRHHEAARR